MKIRLISLVLAMLALGLAACGDSKSPAAKEEGSSASPGYDAPLPPADDEKKKK